MTAMLFGAIFAGGAASGVYAQNGGLIGSGNDNGYYGSGYGDTGGTSSGDDEETEDDNGVIGSGSNRRAAADGKYSWQSIWELFF